MTPEQRAEAKLQEWLSEMDPDLSNSERIRYLNGKILEASDPGGTVGQDHFKYVNHLQDLVESENWELLNSRYFLRLKPRLSDLERLYKEFHIYEIIKKMDVPIEEFVEAISKGTSSIKVYNNAVLYGVLQVIMMDPKDVERIYKVFELTPYDWNQAKKNQSEKSRRIGRHVADTFGL